MNKLEWIEINLPWKKPIDFQSLGGISNDRDRHLEFLRLDREGRKVSFCGQDLNQPGTIVELENGNRLLIGDINKLGGVCDDCQDEIRNETIIKRYVILSKDW